MTNPTAAEVQKIVGWKLKNATDSVAACQTKMAAKLVEMGEGRASVSTISDLTQQLESLNQYIGVMTRMERLAGRYAEGIAEESEFKITMLATLVDLLSRGCEDTWSGRGNELRRCGFEGICRACAEVRGLIC